jgi:hypothetical protein
MVDGTDEFDAEAEAQAKLAKHRDIASAERRRVREMLDRDNEDYRKDIARAAAELEVREGVYVNIVESVMEPTPEWLAKGAVMPFVPKQPKGTTRAIRTVRRVSNPVVLLMHAKGKLTDDQLRACLWYDFTHEKAGLEGRFSTSRHDNSGGGTSGRNPGGAGHIPMTEEEAEARIQFRRARNIIPHMYLKFFEMMVLDGLPVSRVWRFSTAPKHKAEARLRLVAQILADHCNREKLGLNLGVQD